MNLININVSNIEFVLAQYNKIKIYRASSQAGPYTEITDADTRIDIIPEQTSYWYTDAAGITGHWYRTSYYNSDTVSESDLSTPWQSGVKVGKVGYSFQNYSPPPGEWGELITPDDLRYTWLFGIDCVGSDIAQTEWTDEQFKYVIQQAIGDFEATLNIDIVKKIYKTNPDSSLVRSRYWREGVDYTDIEDTYDFHPELWQNFGFLQLRHCPVISVERAIMYSQVKTQVIDLLTQQWVRLNKESGQIRLFPHGTYAYGPFAIGALPWRLLGTNFPDGFEFDYTTGYPSSDFVPEGLREVVSKWAAIKSLAMIGDGILAGFSSQSVSLDGLSEAFSSTQSATNAYFGARILQYTREIATWISQNKYKFGRGPTVGFVGV